jgi:hypothetical protein
MTNNPNDQDTQVSNSSTETENTERMIPKTRFNEVNEENKVLRERLEALETQSQQADAERQKQQQKELAEQNRYKELYEQTLQQLESLKSVQDEVKRYRESFENTLQSRIQLIPEDKRALIPEYDDPIKTMAWLDKALPELTTPPKPNAPRLDGGSGSAGGAGNPVGSLSPTQQQLIDIARDMGHTIDVNRVAAYNSNPPKQTDLENKGDKP